MAVEITSLGLAEDRIAVGQPRLTVVQLEAQKREIEERARYKIELHLGKDRTTHGLCSGAVLIWESGRRLHGGGDEKMYWCGYPDCKKPMSTDNFAYMHVVCTACQREQFLDHYAKEAHIKEIRSQGKGSADIEKLPTVVGELFFKLPPPKIADLLAATFNDLQRNADIYLKFHPLDIRYAGRSETTADINRLELGRLRRDPLIYPLSRIVKDLVSGADLRGRILAMIEA